MILLRQIILIFRARLLKRVWRRRIRRSRPGRISKIFSSSVDGINAFDVSHRCGMVSPSVRVFGIAGEDLKIFNYRRFYNSLMDHLFHLFFYNSCTLLMSLLFCLFFYAPSAIMHISQYMVTLTIWFCEER